jgi:hypothetical protein
MGGPQSRLGWLGRVDLGAEFLVLLGRQDQAGQVKHLVTGHRGGDGDYHVSPGLDSDDGFSAEPADDSRDWLPQ